ncbi:hypothetical protein PV326_007283 [Microctonus aethiopoides]|nr:hypothetical protein PV326_007283 [Microctonus aethiopoides]
MGAVDKKKGMNRKECLIDLRDEWCQNLGINIKSELGVAVICSLHFKEDQFSFASQFFKNKRLKKRAIPTELIPKKITDVAKKSEELESLRQERREKRDNEKENVKRKLESEKVRILPKMSLKRNKKPPKIMNLKIILQVNYNLKYNDYYYDENSLFGDDKSSKPEDIDCAITACEKELDEFDDDNQKCTVEEAVLELNSAMKSRAEHCDVAVQVNSGDLLGLFASGIKTEIKLMALCGIKSFKILVEICDLVDQLYRR